MSARPHPPRDIPAPTTREAWEVYEAAKNAWLRDHPNASAAEYERAMQAVLRELGV